jgi:serine/threonine protein kinase/predicted esterase/Tfp pilus assembly protein PilF
MKEPTRPPDGTGLEHAGDEELLARCIERLPARGPACVEEVCGGDPELSARLRLRLAALERFGLLSGQEQGGAPVSIGPHRILDFLGEGGMGAVYLGVDDRLGRRVAIKVGHAGHVGRGSSAASLRSRARFDREIRAVAQLEHPGIVRIYDVGESDGRPYFTMEFVEGVTLARIIEELCERKVAFEQLSTAVLREIVESSARPPDSRPGDSRPGDPRAGSSSESSAWGATYVETVCRWVVEIADALAHAHAHSIVHRDVKPSNVMVRRDGRAKLFDLGLARMDDQPALTRSGDLAGSPYYMSPEQVSGPQERVDRRTDVYSLGVTLYELLTLRRPFEGPTSAHVFRQIAGKEPPLPRKLNPLVPRDLETICLTALEKDPERRYPSMEEFAADLRRLLAFSPVRAKPAGIARRTARYVRRNPALASAFFLTGLMIVGLPIGLLMANSAIRAEERRATREADLKSRVTEFLISQFQVTENEREKGADISARELLDRGVGRLEAAFEDDPLVRAELLTATGTVYKNLGLNERAIPLLDRALAIRQTTAGQDASSLAHLLNALAEAHLAAGQPETARRLCLRGLRLLDDAARADRMESVSLERTLAEAAGLMGDHDEAERALSAALASLRARAVPHEKETAAVLESLGVAALERGDPARAREELAEALAMHRKAWSPDVDAIGRVVGLMARVDEARGDFAQAAIERREAARYSGASTPPTTAARLPFAFEAASKPEYEQSFQTGITALQSRELEHAIAAFKRCLELDPSRSVCAYNIACGYALSGDVERGLEWLARAADMGFGVAEYRLNVASSVPEVASLRAEARGAAILERMRLQGDRVRAFAAEPASLPAPPGAGGEAAPLLVVLHAPGRTKLDVVAGPWARVAHDLGAALLAPSGSIPMAAEPEQGMAWFEDPDDLVRKPTECERGVCDAARAFMADHSIDPSRVWIAGEGLGAMVAFDVALRAPGLFKSVMLVDGPIHPETSLVHARRAASLGLRTAFVIDAGIVSAKLAPSTLAAAVGRWLTECGFVDPQVITRPAEGEGDGADLLRGVLTGWNG